MTNNPLSGVIAAISTPVTPDHAPDHERFLTLAGYLLANGCDGLNVLGTTGEATSFTLEQRMGLMSAVAKAGLPLERMMVGTGAAAVGDAVRLTRHAEDLGFAVALVLPPFYYKGVSDEGVSRYFDAIVAGTERIPIYLYNFPAMSGVPYTVPLIEKLIAQFGARIAGLKDSSGDLTYARQVAALASALRVFPSNEAVLLEARKGTFAGCISATANVNAPLCARAFHSGDEAAQTAANSIRALFNGLPLVPAVKSLVAHMHGDEELGRTAPPLATLSDDQKKSLIADFDRQMAGV